MSYCTALFVCLLPIAWYGSASAQVSSKADSSDFVPWSEFQYAGQRLYTIDGSQPRYTTEIKPLPAMIMGTTITALVVGLHIYQKNTIWTQSASFRIIDDWEAELNADKGGHFWGTYLESRLATDFLMGAGYSRELAVVCGALTGLGYQFYVEVLDGYGKNWGFSPSDMLFNLLGFSFFLGHHYSPFLQNFSPKAEFYPAYWFGEKTRKEALSVLDDYSAWTWWLSVNVHNLLPKTLQSYYPSWLNIAIGYAGRNLGWSDQTRKFIISLDLNLEQLLPEGGSFWNWLRQYLNMIKLPAPAVEFSPDSPPRWYLLYPFKF